jgi:hypothetical protein
MKTQRGTVLVHGFQDGSLGLQLHGGAFVLLTAVSTWCGIISVAFTLPRSFAGTAAPGFVKDAFAKSLEELPRGAMASAESRVAATTASFDKKDTISLS